MSRKVQPLCWALKRRTNEAALRARAGSVRTTLERLRVMVQEPSEATRRELVESLVEGIEVVPVTRGTKRVPQITIRYCFDLGTPSEPPREAAVRTPVEQTDLSICNRRGSPAFAEETLGLLRVVISTSAEVGQPHAAPVITGRCQTGHADLLLERDTRSCACSTHPP
jgi:hypothetical protein